MPRPLNIDLIFNDFKTFHGDKYDYSESEITGARAKIKIVCPVHGVFEQRVDHHRSGSGCQKCRPDKIREALTTSVDEYISTVVSIHGDKYDYSLTEYQNNKTKIKIICPVHGVFEQRPTNHLQGRGCQKCGIVKVADIRRSNLTDFKESSRAVHGDRYTYPDQEYVNGHKYLRIVCKKHGEFSQTPANHLSGKGCPGCGRYGFRSDIDAVLYVLASNCSQFIKIGITSHAGQRIEQLKRDTPFSFKILFTFEMPGRAARPMEMHAHKQFKNAGFKGFGGATEWLHADHRALNYVVAMCGAGKRETLL